MPILTAQVAALQVFRFKAPKSTMYEIHGIFIDIVSAGNNSIGVLNYLVEDQITTKNAGVDFEGFLVAIEGDIQRSTNIIFPIPEITKFISVLTRSSSSFEAFVAINYKLKPATRTELLIEWFRKGR